MTPSSPPTSKSVLEPSLFPSSGTVVFPQCSRFDELFETAMELPVDKCMDDAPVIARRVNGSKILGFCSLEDEIGGIRSSQWEVTPRASVVLHLLSNPQWIREDHIVFSITICPGGKLARVCAEHTVIRDKHNLAIVGTDSLPGDDPPREDEKIAQPSLESRFARRSR